MVAAPIEVTSLDTLIEMTTQETQDIKQATVYVCTPPYNLRLNLGPDFERIEGGNEGLLKLGYLNDKTLEMVLIMDDSMRIYKYSNKEVYKTDARILRSKTEEMREEGN